MTSIDLLFWLFACFAFLLGAAVGSFLNVVIYRVPAGLSIIRPPSRCPHCESPIRWYDNIPIISWTLLLGGKCRDCGVDIPAQYTIVEALTGFLTLLLWYKVAQAPFSSMAAFEDTLPLSYLLPFGFYFIFICLLIVITFVDLEHLLIPHVFTLPGIALGLAAPLIFDLTLPPGALQGFWPPLTPLESLIGAAAGGLTVIAIFYGYFAIRGIPGIGGGDVTLMALVGAWLGWPALVFVFFAASLQGVIAAGLAMAFGGGLLRDGAQVFADGELLEAEELNETLKEDSQRQPKTLSVDEDNEQLDEELKGADDKKAAKNENKEQLNDQPETLKTPDADLDKTHSPQKSAPLESSSDLIDSAGAQNAETHENEDEVLSEEDAPGPMAVPFGPFIALAALEHFFLGDLLPAAASMSYLYEFGAW